MAWYGIAYRNVVTIVSLTFFIWCGCSVAQNQIVFLLMISSKWKSALSVSDVFFFYYAICCCPVAASVSCPIQQVCARKKWRSEFWIHWIEWCEIPCFPILLIYWGCAGWPVVKLAHSLGIRCLTFGPKLIFTHWTAASVCIYCF